MFSIDSGPVRFCADAFGVNNEIASSNAHNAESQCSAPSARAQLDTDQPWRKNQRVQKKTEPANIKRRVI